MPTKTDLEKTSNYKFTGTGLSKKEIKWAYKRFKSYSKSYHIVLLSDLQLLEELVFRETLHERTKLALKQYTDEKAKISKEKIADVVPISIFRVLDENQNHMLVLKEKLGFFLDKKQKDPFQYINLLKKKAAIHREENKGDYTIPCPSCSEPIMLIFRTKFYDAINHPFFKGKFLTNKYLWKLYKEFGKITKLDVAKVLLGENVNSVDYVDFIEKKLYSDISK